MTIPRVGKRVMVMLGDGITLIGEGEIVDEVTVYFAQMPDGSLRSFENAELRPPQEWVDAAAKMGVKLVESTDNPKILMDDGTVRYGCQVWWKEIRPHPLKKIITPSDYLQ